MWLLLRNMRRMSGEQNSVVTCFFCQGRGTDSKQLVWNRVKYTRRWLHPANCNTDCIFCHHIIEWHFRGKFTDAEIPQPSLHYWLAHWAGLCLGKIWCPPTPLNSFLEHFEEVIVSPESWLPLHKMKIWHINFNSLSLRQFLFTGQTVFFFNCFPSSLKAHYQDCQPRSVELCSPYVKT